MLFRTFAQLGLTEPQIIDMLNKNGEVTPESIAKVIAVNNNLLVNQINTVMQANNEEIRNTLKK